MRNRPIITHQNQIKIYPISNRVKLNSNALQFTYKNTKLFALNIFQLNCVLLLTSGVLEGKINPETSPMYKETKTTNAFLIFYVRDVIEQNKNVRHSWTAL